MSGDIKTVFGGDTGMLFLYGAIRKRMIRAFPDISIKVGETQVCFSNGRGFAYIRPQARKVAGCPGNYVILIFGLPFRIEDERARAVQSCHGRWTHYIVISRPADLNRPVMDGLRQAYEFIGSERGHAPGAQDGNMRGSGGGADSF